MSNIHQYLISDISPLPESYYHSAIVITVHNTWTYLPMTQKFWEVSLNLILIHGLIALYNLNFVFALYYPCLRTLWWSQKITGNLGDIWHNRHKWHKPWRIIHSRATSVANNHKLAGHKNFIYKGDRSKLLFQQFHDLFKKTMLNLLITLKQLTEFVFNVQMLEDVILIFQPTNDHSWCVVKISTPLKG